MSKISNKIKIFLILVIVVILISGFLGVKKWKGIENNQEVIITLYNQVYQQGNNPQLKIENYLGASICFSTNNPYYLEKKVGEEWEEYKYFGIEDEDIITKCMNPEDIKAFELISPIRKGFHKVAIPVCLNCELGQKFKESQRFYSDLFVIK